MKILAETITRYDVIAIQEIRDKSGSAIEKLEVEVDALGDNYDVLIGPRLGRTKLKEQYAFIYKTSTLETETSSAYTYNDLPDDIFHREPFIAQFKVKDGSFNFVLINIHTDPDDATAEIITLVDVVEDSRSHFPNEKDFIILGDLNADCTYFDEDDMSIDLRSDEYLWIVKNDEDTNLASDLVCT